MKTIWLHMQGYRNLPDDFRDRYESIWVTAPNDELVDPELVGQYLHANLEELRFADSMGFDGIGTNEHHQNGYGFPVSPHMTGGILASWKSDAAICLLGTTLPLYHPLRVAEELAAIDCMSGGRLVAGWPVGSAMDTCGVIGLPPDTVRPRYYEAHDFIKQAWSRPGPFPFNGEFTKQRYVNPWPRPIQKPHPPIWLAGGGSVETWQFAADMDYTYNFLSFGGYKVAQRQMDSYWSVVGEHGERDDNPYRAGYAQLICVADTDAEAKRLYWPHVKNFYDKSMYIAPQFSVVPGYTSRASMQHMMKATGSASPFAVRKSTAGKLVAEPSWERFIEEGAVIGGSPDTVAQRLEEAVRRLRVGHLIAIMQLQSMDTELTKYNTKLFAEKVLPKTRTIWDDEGYVDQWWPSGATRNQPTAAETLTGAH
ncbi:LLM class flavin-dependent oxidoreductase [Pseudonocardia kujensis]|uniref:LLM class flavin-dependent oxidoreductase n=1 Tax=Pseudonocardia kujensis TaxID=1128675 RepID=UPI001E50CB73|nr:LLM class flavin-dependent oxidoreductase [Pseudonocardia kujensis]MCE0767742.1 LLM class flavin-dependent oxidoreductase [Pseudonocardia kujensis]